ncbi:MAG: AAA family ATPase [Xanthomonadaceae bacterium]|nr:AAA family ATPase [Xanthomonadaceae bacterium]
MTTSRISTALIASMILGSACTTSQPYEDYLDYTNENRHPASVGKNLIQAFVDLMEIALKKSHGPKAPPLSEIERIVAEEVSSRIPNLSKKFSKIDELYNEISKSTNPETIQMDALRQSILKISRKLGESAHLAIDETAALVALKQVQIELAIKAGVSAQRISKLRTRAMTNTLAHKIEKAGAGGSVHSFIVTGDLNDLMVVADASGESVVVEGASVLTKEGDLSAYDHVIHFNTAEMSMDPSTRKEFVNWLKSYDNVNRTQYALHVNETMTGDLFTRMKLIDAFNQGQMLSAKRVAIVLEDAHRYIGNPEKSGAFNDPVFGIVKKWLTKNPSIKGRELGKIMRHEADGKKAFFKCFIQTPKTERLAKEVLEIGGVARVHFPIASYSDRLRHISSLLDNPDYDDLLDSSLTREVFAGRTSGVSLKTLENMLEQAKNSGLKINLKQVLVMFKESLEERFGKDMIEVIIPEFPPGKLEAALKANPLVEAEIDKALKYLDQTGEGLDRLGSRGIMFTGPFGAFKTTLASLVAMKKNTVLIRIKTLTKGCHGCSNDLAVQYQEIAYEAENVVHFIDEAHKMPKTTGDAGINQVIGDDVSATAATWFETISESPIKKTRSIFVLATSDPNLLDGAITREGRIGVHIPLNHLVELGPRKLALGELLQKMKDELGEVDVSTFTDAQIEAMPTKNIFEMEEFLNKASSYKKAGQNLSKADFDQALDNISFPRGNFSLAERAEINKLFFCSNRDLLPEYAKAIPAYQFDQAKNAWLKQGRKPDFLKVPTWVTGYGGKDASKKSAAKLAADEAKSEE